MTEWGPSSPVSGPIPSLPCGRRWFAVWQGCLVAGLLLVGCQKGHQDNEATRFLEKVRAAYACESVDELLELYAWEGVPRERRRSIRIALEFEIDLPVRTLEIRPIRSVREMEDHLADGSLRPNLHPEYYLWMEYDTSERLSYSMLVGRNSAGELRLIVGVPVDEKVSPHPR